MEHQHDQDSTIVKLEESQSHNQPSMLDDSRDQYDERIEDPLTKKEISKTKQIKMIEIVQKSRRINKKLTEGQISDNYCAIVKSEESQSHDQQDMLDDLYDDVEHNKDQLTKKQINRTKQMKMKEVPSKTKKIEEGQISYVNVKSQETWSRDQQGILDSYNQHEKHRDEQHIKKEIKHRPIKEKKKNNLLKQKIQQSKKAQKKLKQFQSGYSDNENSQKISQEHLKNKKQENNQQNRKHKLISKPKRCISQKQNPIIRIPKKIYELLTEKEVIAMSNARIKQIEAENKQKQ